MRTQALAALKELRYPVAAAKQALDEVLRVARTERDVGAIVKATIATLRPASTDTLGGATAASIGAATLIETAEQALGGLGWTCGIAALADEAAHAHVGVDAELGTLIREALRRCGP